MWRTFISCTCWTLSGPDPRTSWSVMMWSYSSPQCWFGRSLPYSVTTLKRISWDFPHVLTSSLGSQFCEAKLNGFGLNHLSWLPVSSQRVLNAQYLIEQSISPSTASSVCMTFYSSCPMDQRSWRTSLTSWTLSSMATFLDIEIYERPDGSLGYKV